MAREISFMQAGILRRIRIDDYKDETRKELIQRMERDEKMMIRDEDDRKEFKKYLHFNNGKLFKRTMKIFPNNTWTPVFPDTQKTIHFYLECKPKNRRINFSWWSRSYVAMYPDGTMAVRHPSRDSSFYMQIHPAFYRFMRILNHHPREVQRIQRQRTRILSDYLIRDLVPIVSSFF